MLVGKLTVDSKIRNKGDKETPSVVSCWILRGPKNFATTFLASGFELPKIWSQQSLDSLSSGSRDKQSHLNSSVGRRYWLMLLLEFKLLPAIWEFVHPQLNKTFRPVPLSFAKIHQFISYPSYAWDSTSNLA